MSPNTHNAHQSDRCSPQIRMALCCSRARISLRSWLCGSTKETIGFVVNHCKPYRIGMTSTPLPLKTWPPRLSRLGLVFEAQPRNYTRFRLAHPCYHAAHSLSRWPPDPLNQAYFSVHTWSPLRHRPFALVLHQHQRKSSRLQY
jgi:hypothetical protein